MFGFTTKASLVNLRLPLLCSALLLTAACSSPVATTQSSKGYEVAQTNQRAYLIDPQRKHAAIAEVKAKRDKGQRVWCVPFARDLSGISLRGNAGTWWNAADGVYDRGGDPVIGSVMTFSSTRKNPMGHVAVVSEVVSNREILIDHANWSRNKVSLKMPVIDVSDKNDWSKVRVIGEDGNSKTIYPISGFIYPELASNS